MRIINQSNICVINQISKNADEEGYIPIESAIIVLQNLMNDGISHLKVESTYYDDTNVYGVSIRDETEQERTDRINEEIAKQQKILATLQKKDTANKKKIRQIEKIIEGLS